MSPRPLSRRQYILIFVLCVVAALVGVGVTYAVYWTWLALSVVLGL